MIWNKKKARSTTCIQVTYNVIIFHTSVKDCYQSAFFGELDSHLVLIYFLIMGCTLSLVWQPFILSGPDGIGAY